jgi:hypothetical protein
MYSTHRLLSGNYLPWVFSMAQKKYASSPETEKREVKKNNDKYIIMHNKSMLVSVKK